MVALSSDATICLHCALPLVDRGSAPFCCTGCRVVYGLLRREGLDRYYDLQAGDGRSVVLADAARSDRKWLDAIEARFADESSSGLARVDLDVQGLHCTGCVWLIETLFARRPGAAGVIVNPALGRVSITADHEFPLRAFVEDVERFGYLFGPPLKRGDGRANGLLARVGITVAIAMNSMIFAIAIYAGLSEGPLYHLFQRANFLLSFVSVAVGGADRSTRIYFARAARTSSTRSTSSSP